MWLISNLSLAEGHLVLCGGFNHVASSVMAEHGRIQNNELKEKEKKNHLASLPWPSMAEYRMMKLKKKPSSVPDSDE